jgi:hypothetical protein
VENDSCRQSASCLHCASNKTCCTDSCCTNSTRQPSGTTWVIGSLKLRCGGLTTLWVIAGATLPPPVRYAADDRPHGWLAALAARHAGNIHSPPSPPPRRAAV